MKLSILFGGKAGLGPNILGSILGEALVKQGYYVFYSRDYQSLIRGGHNFNVLTFSDKPVYSNETKIDILVALDENTVRIHKKDLKKRAEIIKGSHVNMYFAGALFKVLGLDFKILKNRLKSLRNFEENLKSAKKGYIEEKERYEIKRLKRKKLTFMNGTQGIAHGAIRSGLDVYYAYPMTPATPLLGILAQKQIEHNYLVLEPENEIAVINAAVGSAITGAKSMLGTSGGGFDLMTETLSMCGMVGIPLVIYLAQRPGPGTGVPTYTRQGDLNDARHAGHGEFPRIVLAPGNPIEAAELTSEAFYFSQKYKIPCIVLSDKHLAESFYTFTRKPRIKRSNKSTKLIKYTSYEHFKKGVSTEDAKKVRKGVEERLKKNKKIKKEAEKFRMFKIYGNKKSKNLIIGWGSTKGAILDAIKGLNCKFLQVLYIEPFSIKIKKHLKRAKNVVVVENNSTSQLSDVITEKTGFLIKNKILKYDARPFFGEELNKLIRKKLK